MTMFCNKPKLKETFTSFSIFKNYRDGEDRVTRQQKKVRGCNGNKANVI